MKPMASIRNIINCVEGATLSFSRNFTVKAGNLALLCGADISLPGCGFVPVAP